MNSTEKTNAKKFTKRFKTKTEIVPKNNGIQQNFDWLLAVDIGYSGVKLFSPNTIARFPSYAKKLEDEQDINSMFITETPQNTIFIKSYNEAGEEEVWIVGELAQKLMDTHNYTESEKSLYGRERLLTPMYRILFKTALGIGLMSNEYGSYTGQKISVQTGLPERYLSDSDTLKEVLGEHHRFDIKIENGDWIHYDLDINTDDIYVMSQPMGSLLSVCFNKDGSWHADAKKYLNSNVLVFDPGFGTLDLFQLRSGVVKQGDTFSDLGMKQILQETANLIKSNYHKEISVSAMQPYLAEGTIKVGDRRKLITEEKPIHKFLESSSKKICEEAITRMAENFDISEFEYLIITGGTGAAWKEYIEERLSGVTTLTILYGNQNDSLPFVYSNVRGYYLFRYNKLARKAA